MRQEVAQVAAVKPGRTAGTLDEEVGFGIYQRAADDFT